MNRSRHLRKIDQFVFTFPGLFTIFALMVFPLIYTFWMSLQEWLVSSITAPKFIGIGNYIRIFTKDPRFVNALINTLYFTILALMVETILGVAIALVFNRRFYGNGLARTLFIFPMVATPVAIALVWMLMFNPTLGILNYFLELLHLPDLLWVSDKKTVIPALVLVDAWQWIPFISLIVLAGLSSLPTEPFESAVIDGGNGWQIFWWITLPMIRPSIMVAVLFRAIDAIKTFDFIYVMTQGGPGHASETLNLYIFQTSFNYFRMGYASSLLMIFFALIMVMSIILIRLRRVQES
jgi:multiple sugar transport system permease protein